MAKIVVQLVSAIAHCHARGVMHRDLKPENILCLADDQEQLKLCDFGLAYARIAFELHVWLHLEPLRNCRLIHQCACMISPPVIADVSLSRTDSFSNKQALSSTLRLKCSPTAWGMDLQLTFGALVSSLMSCFVVVYHFAAPRQKKQSMPSCVHL